MRLTFFGAAGGAVVPSRFYLRGNNCTGSTLIDCGAVISEEKNASNEQVFTPLNPNEVENVVLTHGHTDHVGALCDFVRQGFNGKVISNDPTRDITEAMLRDNYAKSIVDAVSERFERPKKFLKEFEILDGVYATFYPASGHILGASSVLIRLSSGLRILFSGDLGNTNKHMLDINGDPPEADIVIMESTYGKREHHPDFDLSLKELNDGINDTYENRGNFYIPVLSINRLQEILYYVNLAIENSLVHEDINVAVESNLGEVITDIYSQEKNRWYYSRDAQNFFSNFSKAYPFQYKKHINEDGRNVIIASSGLTGLRGKFRRHLGDLSSGNNSVAVVSHSIEGSPLHDIASRKEQIGVNGNSINLRARTFNLSGFSSHADATQLLRWLGKTKAKFVFLVHGEDNSRIKLKAMIARGGLCQEENIFMPALNEEFDLTNLPRVNNSAISRIIPSVPLLADTGTTEPKITLFGQELKIKPQK